VERMTGLDAGFLYMETPSQHMHTLKVAVLDPSTAPGGYSFERVGEVLGERLHRLPPFRRRAVPVPFGLHHPVWIEDGRFDMSAHVKRVVLPEPGDHAQLDAAVADVASTPLARDRPLWELVVVDGLSDGRVAFIAKVHHALADGVRSAALLAAAMDTTPDTVAEPAPRWMPEAVPSTSRLILDALRDRLGQLKALMPLLLRTFRGMTAARRHRRGSEVSAPLPFAAPGVSFNAALTPRRSYATVSVKLDDVRKVKSAFDVSVNDVVLAMCAGALRRYLDDRGELPPVPLVTGVPVSTRTPDQSEHGNRVSNIFTALPTHLADPVARLRAAHDVMQAAKAQHEALGSDVLAEWSEMTPPPPFAAFIRTYSRLDLANRHRPPINLVVSNVPGPSQPLYAAGAELLEIASAGPVLEGIGVNITFWSYAGQMTASVLGCRDTVPEPSRIANYLGDELHQLGTLHETV
jgi:diacylglycerol O-acyltransferase